jgi:urease accessory protein
VDPPRSAVRDLTAPGPELDRVGRDGFVRLAFERRAGATVMAQCRFATPLHVPEPLRLAQDGTVAVMLLNPTGGLAGGDRLAVEMELGAGTHVCVTTPSATRVYRTLGPAAEQRTRIQVGEGATLEYVPDHVIPHPGARLEQTLAVELAPGARAILWDAWAMGRLARGERWAFLSLASRIEVSSCGRPAFLDRMELIPERASLLGRGGMDGFGYVATLVALDPAFTAWPALAEELTAHLAHTSRGSGGASPLARGGCAVRCLAATAYELSDTLAAVWGLLRRRLLGLAGLDLRKQ